MKITAFDRNTCVAVREALQKAVTSVGEEFGIQVQLGRGSFNPENFTVKVEACIPTAGGEAMTPEATRFKHSATLFGFKEEDLFAEFTWQQEKWKLVGINKTGTKVLCRKLSNKKVYLAPTDTVLLVLGRKTARPMAPPLVNR